jgi:hypothetical protein
VNSVCASRPAIATPVERPCQYVMLVHLPDSHTAENGDLEKSKHWFTACSDTVDTDAIDALETIEAD